MAQYKTKPSNTPDQFLRRQRMLEEQKRYGKYSSARLLIFVCHYFFFGPCRVFLWCMLYLLCKLITYDRPSASLFNVIMYNVHCTSTHNTISIKKSVNFALCLSVLLPFSVLYIYIFPDVDLFGNLNSDIAKELFVIAFSTYLLLTKFEGCTIRYGPSFFLLNLWPKREARRP